MPNMTIPFVSRETSIYVDIYNKIAKDVAEIIGVGPKKLRVLYNSMEVSKTDIVSNAKYRSTPNTPTTNANSRLTVNVTDDYDEEMIGSEIVNTRDHFPIFRDTDIGVSIAPVYTTNNMEFEFSYISTSKIEIEDIRDRLRMLLSRTINLFEHSVEYSLIIPHRVIEFISDVHELKSRLFPVEFPIYLRENSTNRLHLLTDMSNVENMKFAVKEKVHRINGSFDFTTNPPPRETDSSRNIHRLRFTYNIQMEVPRALTLHYPIIVCNRLMKDEYLIPILEREEMIQRRIEQPLNYLGRSATIMHNLATNREQPISYTSPYPIRIPIYDRFESYQELPGYSVILTMLISVNEDDRRTLFNLKELGDYYIKDKALNYIKDNKLAVTTHYGGLLFFGLEQGNRHMCSEQLRIDNDLNVRSKVELDLMTPVRVTLSICLDLNYLAEPIRKELFNNDDMFINYISEFIELRDWLTIKADSDHRQRDLLLAKLIIQKLSLLYSYRELDTARDLCAVISKDPKLSMHIGYILVMSFPQLLDNLVSKGVAYIHHGGALRPQSTVSELKRRQLNEHHNRKGRTRGGYTGIRPESWEYTTKDGDVYTSGIEDYTLEPLGPKGPVDFDKGDFDIVDRDKSGESGPLMRPPSPGDTITKVEPNDPERDRIFQGFDNGIMKTVAEYGIIAKRRDR